MVMTKMLLKELERLYQEYAAAVVQAVQKSKPGAGLWGFGSGPADHPCHQRFTDGVEALLGEAAQGRLLSGEVRQILEYIYRAPLEVEEDGLTYWTMIAVHNLTLDLCAGLTAEDRAAVLGWYEKAYPRHRRLPAQKNVISALKAAK